LQQNPLVGRYLESGAWSLPIWSKHIYWTGSWRLLTPDMIREALRRDVQSLRLRAAGAWVPVPLGVIRMLLPFRQRILPIMQRMREIGTKPRYVQSGPAAAQTAQVNEILQDCSVAQSVAEPEASEQSPPPAFKVESLDAAFEHMLRDVQPMRDAIARRVVLVCGNLAPGGAERQVTYTVKGLSSQPLESVQLICHYLTREHAGRLDFYLPHIIEAGVAVRELNRRTASSDLSRMPSAFRDVGPFIHGGLLTDIADLYLEFKEIKPEVVHAWLDWDNVRSGLAAALAGVPKIILSGRNINPSNFALYQPYMDPAYRVLATLPNVKIINNSRAGADDYARWIGIPPEHIKVVHNAVSFEAWKRPDSLAIKAARRKYGIADDHFVVGGVFRFNEEKRPLLWVNTAAHIAKRLPNARFILFGQGPLQQEMIQISHGHGLTDRLVLAGVTDDPLSAMTLMDVVLLTSFGEGLPNVLLEAQWAGTPVVTTDAGGAKEAIEVGCTGWVAPSNEAFDIGELIVSLHSQPNLLSRARARGPAFVRESFSVEKMISETLRVYDFAPENP
jgi:glycosyltransferase involved in cell wall biosynthesis